MEINKEHTYIHTTILYDKKHRTRTFYFTAHVIVNKEHTDIRTTIQYKKRQPQT